MQTNVGLTDFRIQCQSKLTVAVAIFGASRWYYGKISKIYTEFYQNAKMQRFQKAKAL